MSKNVGKWIKDDTIDGSKVRLNNEQPLRGRNALDTADIEIIKVNSTDKGELLVEPVYNGDPTTPQSLVNKQYVLDALAGIRDPKDAVRALSSSALPANTPTGDGVSKTLTADANGALVLDGVTLLLNDRVGVIGEGTSNGIYDVTQVGDVGTPWILTRSTDADEDVEVTQGMSFDVVEGTAHGKTRWLLTTTNINVDTTSLTFVETPIAQATVQFKTEKFTLSAGDIVNGYVDLANNAESQSLVVYPVDGPVQEDSVDFTVSVPTTVTRVTFAGDLLELLEGEVLVVKYAHF